MIISKTPYRLSFFGGGTDYVPWYRENGGLIIASAIAKHCYISIRSLPPFFEHKTRAVYSKIEMVKDHAEIQHPSIQQCLKFMKIDNGLEIHYDGDLPSRSGIGSSSSFTVGFLNALHALRFELATNRRLADEAIDVEHNWIKEDVGIQDQIMAAYGGLQVIEMGPGESYRVSPLILPPDYLKALEDHVMLAFTGISRYSVQFASEQIKNIVSGQSSSQLAEIHALAKAALELFTKNESFEKLGSLLNESWQLKRRLTQTVSNAHIDDIYQTARRHGAFGGKLMGAGGGGFILLMAPPHKHAAIREALGQIKVWVPYKIDPQGSQILLHNDRED